MVPVYQYNTGISHLDHGNLQHVRRDSRAQGLRRTFVSGLSHPGIPTKAFPREVFGLSLATANSPPKRILFPPYYAHQPPLFRAAWRERPCMF